MGMSPDIILGLIIGVPVLVLVLLRVNATLVFLSLCLGSVLVQYVAPDTRSFVALFSHNGVSVASASDNTIKLVLLLFPVVLTTIFMIRTVRGKGKLILNALPAIGVGLLGALLIVPLLSAGLRHNILLSDLWQQVEKAQVLIVGASALVCLLVLWMQRPKTGGEGKHHGKHHKG